MRFADNGLRRILSLSAIALLSALMVIGFVTRLPVAFLLGWLFVRTRSIWASVGLHVAFNATLLLLAEYYLRVGGINHNGVINWVIVPSTRTTAGPAPINPTFIVPS